MLGRHRRGIKTLLLAILFIVGFRVLALILIQRQPTETSQITYREHVGFEILNITGFVNDGRLGQPECHELRCEGELQVQKSLFLEDDLIYIARSLDGHPMLDYSGQDQSLSFEETVARTWTRLSGSSIWLEKYRVFLAVSRVIFYDEGVRQWPVISFLRGQIYDENWNEKKNFNLHWHGRDIVFPTVFPISCPYKKGARFFGPEDPRIIIEEKLDDVEPIIVFNMIHDPHTWTRAMHIFRPFSNVTTILTIVDDEERAVAEKNWAPFFLDDDKNIAAGRKGEQSKYIHFIYRFSPLTVLKCRILTGLCEVIFEQDIANYVPGIHDDDHGRMTGGTNLVPLPWKSELGAQLFLGFPRSHVDVGCNGKSMYRPALMIMSAQRSEFHLDYMSSSIDFGSAALSEEAFIDPCGEGQILIANSIAKWDMSSSQDILTLSLSVADSTVQILRLLGLRDLVRRLPIFQRESTVSMPQDSQAMLASQFSDLGNHVLGCSMGAAANYSTAIYISGFYKMQEALARWNEEE